MEMNNSKLNFTWKKCGVGPIFFLGGLDDVRLGEQVEVESRKKCGSSLFFSGGLDDVRLGERVDVESRTFPRCLPVAVPIAICFPSWNEAGI